MGENVYMEGKQQGRRVDESVLSWPPRSSTAWTKCAWRAVVHLILGALELLFPPPLLPFPDLVVPPPADNNGADDDEVFLNLWIWLGWCSRCCCWTSSHWPSWSCAAAAVVVWTSPRHSVCLEKSMSLLLASSGGEGGLICSERSGAAAAVVAIVQRQASAAALVNWQQVQPCRLFLLEGGGIGSWWLGHEWRMAYGSYCI
jgi:hypothetical protein